jgi:hypothetical protein
MNADEADVAGWFKQFQNDEGPLVAFKSNSIILEPLERPRGFFSGLSDRGHRF